MSLEKITDSSQEPTIKNLASPTIDFQILKQFEKSMGSEIVLTLIEQFLDYVPEQLIALQQSVATGNRETLRSQAHQFKGESLQIGANQLSELCQQLENIAKQGQLEVVSEKIAQIKPEWAKVKIALTHQVNYYDS